MRKYNIFFTVLELNKFNLIENEDIRKSLMSIYSYFIKINSKENEKFSDAGSNELKKEGVLSISMSNFLKLYNRSHDKISIRTLKNRIDKLKELGLLFIAKIKNKNTYKFLRFEQVNEKVNKKVNEKKCTESVDNTNVDTDLEKHKYLNNKTNTIDIDTSNISTENDTEKEFDSATYKKVSSWSDISEMLNNAFIDFSIKSKTLKSEIIRRIEKNLNGITLAFANNYIEKVIIQVKTQENRRREAYRRAIVNNFNPKNNSSWNYEGQRSYNYAALENALLGWE